MGCIVHGVAKSWTRLSDFHFTSLRPDAARWEARDSKTPPQGV